MLTKGISTTLGKQLGLLLPLSVRFRFCEPPRSLITEWMPLLFSLVLLQPAIFLNWESDTCGILATCSSIYMRSDCSMLCRLPPCENCGSARIWNRFHSSVLHTT